MTKSVWIFPGQGSQTREMLHSIPETYFEQIKRITDRDFKSIAPDFTNTVDVQLAILMTQLYTLTLLTASSLRPAYVAGHSLGAFSAAVMSGVISAEVAIKLVHKRAELMHSLYPAGFGMGAIMGLSRQELIALVQQQHTEAQPLYLSNQNEELQFTVSGSWTSIDQVLAAARNAGAGKAVRLAVPTPSHCLLMAPVAAALEQVAATMTLEPLQYPYLANCNGRLLHRSEEVMEDLIHNVTCPVRWLEMMEVCIEQRVEHFIEFPPGKTLSRLVEKTYPDKFIYAIDQYGIADTVYLYNKRSKQ